MGRDLPGVSINVGEQLSCDLSVEISFETFTSIGSHLSKNEKYLSKIKNFKFNNSLNIFGRDPPQAYAW